MVITEHHLQKITVISYMHLLNNLQREEIKVYLLKLFATAISSASLKTTKRKRKLSHKRSMKLSCSERRRLFTVFFFFIFAPTFPCDCCVLLPSFQKENTRGKNPIGSIPGLRTFLRIRRAQGPNVFMVMSASSRQALEHRTQPHLIRTRLFDLLHYPAITQTG